MGGMHWKARLPYWWRHYKSGRALLWMGHKLEEAMSFAKSAPDDESRSRAVEYLERLVAIGETWKRQFEATGTIGNYRRL